MVIRAFHVFGIVAVNDARERPYADMIDRVTEMSDGGTISMKNIPFFVSM
jgi:hypothetical protein